MSANSFNHTHLIIHYIKKKIYSFCKKVIVIFNEKTVFSIYFCTFCIIFSV